MNSNLLIRKTITICVSVAMIATYSLVALAGTDKAAGEIIISAPGSDGNAPSVIVNGESAKSGRTVFSPSTISTPVGYGAIVSLGKAGRIDLAPNTVISLSFDDAAASGEISSGSVTVLSSSGTVDIKTLAGEILKLNAGETVAVGSVAPAKQTTPPKGGVAWWAWVLIFGGAAAGVVIAASAGNSNNSGLGGTTSTVSPTR